jgi:hypothetical protein
MKGLEPLPWLEALSRTPQSLSQSGGDDLIYVDVTVVLLKHDSKMW